MAKGLIEEQNLKNIANAIREKNGENMEYTPAKMSEKILALEIGTDTTDANATASDIIVNKTAYVNGEKVIGNLEVGTEALSNDNIGNVVITLGGENIDPSITFTANADNSREVIDEDIEMSIGARQAQLATTIGLTADILKSGETVLNIEGSYSGGIDTSDATATADDIAYPQTAYVNGEKLRGTIAETPENTVFNVDVNEVHEYEDRVHVDAQFQYARLIRVGGYVNIVVPKNVLALAIGLKPEKIKAGETILGVTGTYSG